MTFVITPRMAPHLHLPVPLMDRNHTSTDIEMIMDPKDRSSSAHMWDPDQKKLAGYFLPPFQRPPVWTDTQKIRFIESAHLGITLGSIVVVDALNMRMQDNGRFAGTDRWLLDGQQRVSALLAYRNNEITVFAGTACEHRWSDLSEIEQRRIQHVQIGIIKVMTDDPEYCREIYDRLNFGGTAHTEDQRAVATTTARP